MKTLIIVDTQEFYKSKYNSELVKGIKNHIDNSEYDRVVLLVDSNKENFLGDFIPKEFDMDDKNIIFKTYDELYSATKLRPFLNENIQMSMFPSHITSDNGSIIYGMENSEVYVDYADEVMTRFATSLKDSKEIDIVGGIMDLCVKKTELILKSFIDLEKTNINIIKNLCFDSKNVVKKDEISWVYKNNNNKESYDFFKK